MKIHHYQKSTSAQSTRVSMTVSWEERDFPSREIYFETDERFEADINPNPDAYLLAAVMPAVAHRERRILLEGAICPELRNGVVTVMKIFSYWYPEYDLVPIEIEATGGFVPVKALRPPRTVSFLSGGVDALATLRANHLDHAEDSPWRVRDGFFVHGLDIGGYVDMDSNRGNSENALASIREFASQAGVDLIPVVTNIRHVDDDDGRFFRTGFGANLASIAHCFSQRITTALIASGSQMDHLSASGSHPLTDGYYSSTGVTIKHDGARMNRIDKVKLIADQPEALRTLRSCYDAFRPQSALNCGECEKCLRTMTALLIHGRLDQCPTYSLDDLSPKDLEILDPHILAPAGASRKQTLKCAYKAISDANRYFWYEMAVALREMGRDDLAAVVDRKLVEHERDAAWQREEDLRGLLKKLDRRFLGSRLMRLREGLRGL